VLIFDRFDIGNRISNRHLIDAARPQTAISC